jgi:hypothetical protein
MALTSLSSANSGGKPKKLLDQTRDVLRLKHYSVRTERSYCDWISASSIFIAYDIQKKWE